MKIAMLRGLSPVLCVILVGLAEPRFAPARAQEPHKRLAPPDRETVQEAALLARIQVSLTKELHARHVPLSALRRDGGALTAARHARVEKVFPRYMNGAEATTPMTLNIPSPDGLVLTMTLQDGPYVDQAVNGVEQPNDLRGIHGGRFTWSSRVLHTTLPTSGKTVMAVLQYGNRVKSQTVDGVLAAISSGLVKADGLPDGASHMSR